jgi:hypothetical protein
MRRRITGNAEGHGNEKEHKLAVEDRSARKVPQTRKLRVTKRVISQRPDAVSKHRNNLTAQLKSRLKVPPSRQKTIPAAGRGQATVPVRDPMDRLFFGNGRGTLRLACPG